MYPTFLYKCTCPKHAIAKIRVHKVSSVKAFVAYVSHCLVGMAILLLMKLTTRAIQLVLSGQTSPRKALRDECYWDNSYCKQICSAIY